MMSMFGWCSVVLLASLAASAPVENAPAVTGNEVDEVQNQEQELQSLLDLADEKSGRKDVTVHEEHVQHLHEINGHKMEVDTARKTVSDTKTGEILSDVKQEVTKPDESAGAAEAEVQVKTEVDVPAEGVHETIVQTGTEAAQPSDRTEAEQEEAEEAAEEEAEEEEAEEEIDFSPDAVADYLYRTGDFNRFYSALAQLVNASIMTEEEAQTYSQLVALEYDRLQMEEYENNMMVVQRREPQTFERYPVAMDTPVNYPVSMDTQEQFPDEWETPEALFSLNQEPSPKDVDLDPYDLLSALWNEAYGTGDVRAQELVGELFEKVRGDNDPDDEGQVRDVLLDLIANSVMSEESQPQQPPQYGWQPIVDDDTPVMQPIGEPVAPQPMEDQEDEEAAEELMGQGQKRAAEQPTLSAETQPAKEQLMGKSESQAAEAQPRPMAESDTNADDKQTGQEESSGAGEKETPSQNSV